MSSLSPSTNSSSRAAMSATAAITPAQSDRASATVWISVMAAMIGAFLGLKLTVLVVFLSPILATLFALAFLFNTRSAGRAEAENGASGAPPLRSWLLEEVPFGVFLGASGLVALFLGEWIWSAYLGMFR